MQMKREELIKELEQIQDVLKDKHHKLTHTLKKFYPNIYSSLCSLTDKICTVDNPTIYERLYLLKENITDKNDLICPICKKNYRKFKVNKYFDTCSKVCCNKNLEKIIKRKQSRINHFGSYVSKEILEKTQQTCLKKYGKTSYSKLQEFKDKVAETKLKKYGSKTYNNSKKMLHTKEVKYGSKSYNNINKIRETLKQKYNVVAPVQITTVQKQQQLTCLKKYGVKSFLSTKSCSQQSKKQAYEKMMNNSFDIPAFSFDDYLKTRGVVELLFKCKRCNQIFSAIHNSGIHHRCPICYHYVPSKTQFELTSFLKQFVQIIENTRKVIVPYELDVYIPEKKIAIEFDGLYWHCDEVLNNKNYHLYKTKLCEKQGIQLIHIFENEWLKKKEIVKGYLKSLLGIYDKGIFNDFQIKTIDKQISEIFQNENSLSTIDSDVNLGLISNDELNYLMSFSKEQNKSNIWKIDNSCSKLGYSVSYENTSKLLNYFEENYHPKTITWIIDRRWGNGNLQKELGFKLIKTTKPEQHFWKGNVLNHNFKFETTINQDNNKYHTIYDCGKLVYQKEI